MTSESGGSPVPTSLRLLTLLGESCASKLSTPVGGNTDGAVGSSMASYLPAVAEQLLKDLQRTYLEKSQIPDDLLIALRFVFGSCTLQAMDLVDRQSVTRVSSPSGRVAFQVVGGSGRLYTCYTSCHYCSCPAFSFSVLRRNESLVCKHILAAYLCQAMDLCQQEQVSDQHMTLILSGKAQPDP